MTKRPRLFGNLARDEVRPAVDRYTGLHDAGVERKRIDYRQLVENYYELSTGIFEWGWGKHFHFAPRRRGESFIASQLRHQRFLADRLSLKPGMRVLDAGCGVGGPMSHLARLTGASFVGVNISAHQIERAKFHTREVRPLCRFIHADFMRIPVSGNRYDGAISIEAMPHAPDKTAAYGEIFRVLRPGAAFACYEWCLTGDFDPSNAEHLGIRQGIMTGNGLPEIAGTADVRDALRAAGFELIEARDLAGESDPETPWYRPLQGRGLALASISATPFGRALTHLALGAAERLRLAPEGARAAVAMLKRGADALVEGGRTGIFTPMYFFLARKPPRSGGRRRGA